ncbi:MAG: sodium/proline symporter [Leptonema illini]|uniref:Sodium/proline symporter n=1 Tax=Leptonema illini TaxID=183 RepID=A0A833LVY4_9LEPT|nr:MAG: sodium/proline symporter [Leptonema illini]
MTAISFLFFLFCFTLIGVASIRASKQTTDDYLLAGRSVSPLFTALSAVATNNSGFMFIGLIGYTYAVGLSSIWIMVGWIAGDYLAWRWIYPHLRRESEMRDVATVPSYLSHTGDRYGPAVMRIAAVILILFLGVYAAAQLNAGSKALHTLFGWQYETGAIIGAVIVLVYSWSGGIRASIWTDVAQSVVMVGAMLLLVISIVVEVGGVPAAIERLAEIDPSLLTLIPANLKFGFAAFLLSWIAAGIGVTGQPHVIIRAMAIRSVTAMSTARRVYFLWYSLFSALAIAVGLGARILLDHPETFDAELALPIISIKLLHPILIGLILAGLFVATMSTADSQVLACSAAFTQDLLPERYWKNYILAKMGTALVTLLTLSIALFGSQNVFGLVVLSWSILASTLGPLIMLHSLRRPVSGPVSILMMVVGMGAVFLWRAMPGYSDAVYETLPGMSAGFLAYLISQLNQKKR